MRAVIQRVNQASVIVAKETVGTIDQGLMVLLGVAQGDTAAPGGLCVGEGDPDQVVGDGRVHAKTV